MQVLVRMTQDGFRIGQRWLPEVANSLIYLPIFESRVVVLFDLEDCPQNWNLPGEHDSAFVGEGSEVRLQRQRAGWLNG
jgi:hypothetical protein